MMRSKKKIGIVCFVLGALLLVVWGSQSLWRDAAKKEDATAGQYGDLALPVGDYSFYTPPENTEPLTQPESSLISHVKVKNVILLIGDGMGVVQTYFSRLTITEPSGKLNLERLPVTGVMTTYANDKIVTDSAASGTALACGIKTDNRAIGHDPDGDNYVTILEAAKEEGLLTGLVVTSAITHATPASFAAHVDTRYDEIGIAEDITENRVDVILGGGRGVFLPTELGGEREDGRNLLEELKKEGYAVLATAEDLKNCDATKIVGLFQNAAMTTFAPEPTLEEMTRKAIGTLSKSPAGFFMMVEGSQIDWACHANNPENLVKQVLMFDLAVKAATDFAAEDGQTLVVVCADHETGAMSVFGSGEEGLFGDEKKGATAMWNSDKHSGAPVIVYAYGPGSVAFTGVYENTDIARKIAAALKIENFPRKMK